MRVLARILAIVALVGTASAVTSPMTLACSPPFEPSILKLDPTDFVVAGYVGDPVPGGRLFHVYRSFNAVDLTTPFVIAFKEGAPGGDCSYRVSNGQELVIALSPNPVGPPGATLATLQADPASEDGRRYLREAETKFGPGVVPSAAPSLPSGSVDGSAPGDVVALAIGLVGVLAVCALVALVVRRQQARDSD